MLSEPPVGRNRPTYGITVNPRTLFPGSFSRVGLGPGRAQWPVCAGDRGGMAWFVLVCTVLPCGHGLGPGRQRWGSHREAPESHSRLPHTYPRPSASSFPGSHAKGIGGWVRNPRILRFGPNLGISPSADADKAMGPGN